MKSVEKKEMAQKCHGIAFQGMVSVPWASEGRII